MTSQPNAGPVIIAENDDLVRGILRTILLQTGHEILVAADGVQAVALARQRRPLLVLLDIAMPRLSGMLACEAIRALAGRADVPIVMLTGYTDERMRAAARRLGATDFIAKPFQPRLLLAQLARWLGGESAMASAAASRLPLQAIGIPAAKRDDADADADADVDVDANADGDGGTGCAPSGPDPLRGGWVPPDDYACYGSPAALETAYAAAGIPLRLIQKWLGYAPIALDAIAPITPGLADLARSPRAPALAP